MAAVIEKKNVGAREFVAAVFLVLSLFFFMTLLTFSQEDGGWTHSGLSSIPKNAGGIVGAWISDLTFTIFGFEAYLFPLIIAWYSYSIYHHTAHSKGGVAVILRGLGILITLIAGTVIFYLHVPRLPIDFPNGSGGILGQEAGDLLLSILSESNTTWISTSVFLLGLSFFIGFSWFTLVDAIGNLTLSFFALFWQLTTRRQKVAVSNTTPTNAAGKKKNPPNLR